MLFNDADVEAGERLSNAYEKVRAAWESTPPIHELSPSHAVSNIWPALTLSYSAIEQALKVLLARGRGISVPELIALPAAASHPPRRRFNSHDLSWLLGQLGQQDRAVRDAVDADFRTFLSLYSLIPHGSLAAFLADVSGDDGDGYARWRYVLVEFDRPPPRNSPDAMLAAWRCLLLELSRQSEWNARLRALHQEVDDELMRLLAEAGSETGYGSDPDIAREVREWFDSCPNRLSGFASVLHECHNCGSPGIASASESFATLLTHWYRWLAARTASDNTATSMFARRAWGDLGSSGGGPSVVWDEEERVFRPTPWTLEFRSASNPPENAIVVADFQIFSGRLVSLRRLAADHGYRFLENRSFPAAIANSRWCRVYELREPECTDRSLVTFWQRRADEDFFYACEGGALADAPAPFRLWLNQAARIGARRFAEPPLALD